MQDSRLTELVRVLVNYATGAKKGDIIGIRMPSIVKPQALTVLEAILRAGGQSVVRLIPDECVEILCRSGHKHQLEFLHRCDVDEAKSLDGLVSEWGLRNIVKSRLRAGKRTA